MKSAIDTTAVCTVIFNITPAAPLSSPPPFRKETKSARNCAGLTNKPPGQHRMFQRNFNVASPISASTTEMIQKRMTMVSSFHPFFSK